MANLKPVTSTYHDFILHNEKNECRAMPVQHSLSGRGWWFLSPSLISPALMLGPGAILLYIPHETQHTDQEWKRVLHCTLLRSPYYPWADRHKDYPFKSCSFFRWNPNFWKCTLLHSRSCANPRSPRPSPRSVSETGGATNRKWAELRPILFLPGKPESSIKEKGLA